MRILQVTPRYLPSSGGIEVVVQRISEGLLKKGFEVVVYSIDNKSSSSTVESINGVLVKRFSALFGDPLFLPEPKFVASMYNEKADVIHVHNIHTLLPFIVAFSKSNYQKLLLQPHYHRYGQSVMRNSFFELYKKTYKTIFSRTNAIIANSVYEKNALKKDFPFVKNIILLPEGLNIDEAINIERKPVEPKRILYVGTLRSYKNVDKVLKGFANLAKNNQRDFRLVIVGSGPDHDSLVNLASSLNISKLVEWKSYLSRRELLDEYARASVLIMLSFLESFSRVVYDALIIGLPVVVLNFGALENLVSNGFAEGVSATDPESIADALKRATEKSYSKISMNSNVFLDWKIYMNKLVKIYEKL